jgi:hypothetical protein
MTSKIEIHSTRDVKQVKIYAKDRDKLMRYHSS